MNPRTCVVTGEERSPDDMIRFTIDPSDRVVPDTKRKLPGRGVWVSLGRIKLETAIAKGKFARGFGKSVSANETLPNLAERLLEKECLDYLALAKKAGQAITGFSKVEAAVRSGAVAAVVHSGEAAADGRGKIAQALRVSEAEEVKIVDEFEGEKLDKVIGNDNTTHIALLHGGLANGFIRAVGRLEQFRKY